jgi:hypothetical protein
MRLDSWREATTEIAKLQTEIDGIKAELEAPKKTAKEMAAIMRAGTEDGDVWVITKADYEDGIIYEVREDDRTVISQRKMTEADRQERLPEPPPRPVIPVNRER